jgi:hypothetical protein
MLVIKVFNFVSVSSCWWLFIPSSDETDECSFLSCWFAIKEGARIFSFHFSCNTSIMKSWAFLCFNSNWKQFLFLKICSEQDCWFWDCSGNQREAMLYKADNKSQDKNRYRVVYNFFSIAHLFSYSYDYEREYQ